MRTSGKLLIASSNPRTRSMLVGEAGAPSRMTMSAVGFPPTPLPTVGEKGCLKKTLAKVVGELDADRVIVAAHVAHRSLFAEPVDAADERNPRRIDPAEGGIDRAGMDWNHHESVRLLRKCLADQRALLVAVIRLRRHVVLRLRAETLRHPI